MKFQSLKNFKESTNIFMLQKLFYCKLKISSLRFLASPLNSEQNFRYKPKSSCSQRSFHLAKCERKGDKELATCTAEVYCGSLDSSTVTELKILFSIQLHFKPLESYNDTHTHTRLLLILLITVPVHIQRGCIVTKGHDLTLHNT
jgi:hypothetical protein